MKKLLLLFLCLPACATAVQNLDKGTVYRRDMELSINKVKYVGIATVPKSMAYEIIASAPSDMDFFIFRTCHREITTEDAGDKRKYVYIPQAEVESIGSCPAEIIGLNTKGKHSFAYITFEDPEKKLPAVLTCNGQVIKANGVSLCQAASALIQDISFDGEALLSDVENDNPACSLSIEKRSKRFEFKMPPGKCFYTFAEVAQPHRRHRLNTFGYGEIILQEN